MPPENQATAAAQEPESVIEVDLDQTDPTKAVTRSVRTQAAATASQGDEDGTTQREKEFLDRSKAVQKRVGRMERSFEQKLADQEAKHQREMTELRRDLDRVGLERREGASTGAEADHERKMTELQEQLTAAIEKGDSALQAKLTRQMQSEEGRYWAAKAQAQGQITTQRRDETRQATTQTQAQPATKGPTPAGSRFILANEDWWDDPEFATERQYANQVFSLLVNKEGFDANDDETFDEIAARVAVKFKDLGIQKGARRTRRAAEAATETQTRQAPNADVRDRGDANGQNRSSRRTLTSDDVKAMRAVGMNPENNDHCLRWLREAQAFDGVGA